MVQLIEINLLPAEYRVHRRTLHIQRGPFYALIGVGVLIAALWAISSSVGSETQKVVNEKNAVEREIKQHSSIKAEIEQLRREKNSIDDKILALQRIGVNREKWVRLLEVLCRYLPDYTWLVSVHERAGAVPVLDIEGRTRSFPDVATYMEQLKQSEFISSVDLDQLEQIDETQDIYRFRISCGINPNARLGQAGGGQ